VRAFGLDPDHRHRAGTYSFTVTASGASQLHTVEGTLTVLAH